MSEAQINPPSADSAANSQESESEKIVAITTDEVDVKIKEEEDVAPTTTEKKAEDTSEALEKSPAQEQKQGLTSENSGSGEEEAPKESPKDSAIDEALKKDEVKKESNEEPQKDKCEIVGRPTKENKRDCEKIEEEGKTDQTSVIEKTVSVGTSTLPVTETPEVSSTKNDEPPKSVRSSRRGSYNSSRSYGGAGYGYQNYGLTYLPYKSNFEPSEDARRKADEFLKTLKL